MAYRSIRVSDLTGAEGDDADFVTVVVRKHPKLDEAVQFDALPSEIDGLKSAGNLVILEIKNGGEAKQVVATETEFNKLSPKMDEVLKGADGLKGRRKGFSPRAAG